MLIRFGYVAMSMKLENCSPSKTITVKNFERIEGEEDRINRLRRIAGENLQNLMRLLYYNAAHQIHVFRFTSKLVPLATHPLADGWDYTADLGQELARIGEFVREKKMRVSSHPDHFTLINSPKPEVLQASLRDLDYHEKVFQAMGLSEAEMVMHVGGLYGSKDTSLQRFADNFAHLPEGVKKRLLVENDDKSFGAADVMKLCQNLQIPMVLDVHHHRCVNNGEDIRDILPQVFATWGERLPKVHFSSPKSEQNCRAHADDIDVEDFRQFLLAARETGRDFDVMIEAKNKDAAMFKLIREIGKFRGLKVVEQAAVIL